VLIVEIDLLDAQPPQARFAGLLHVFRTSIHAQKLALGRTDISELRGQHHFMLASVNRTPQQLFISADPVHIGRIHEIYAMIDGAVNGGDGFGVVRRTVKLGHAHAAQSDRGDHEFAVTQAPLWHRRQSLGFGGGHVFRRAPLLGSG